MAYIAQTAFEVKNSNIRHEDMQNIPGVFGAVADSVFTPADCSAGFLCKQNALTVSEGYESFNILNGNTWQFVAAADGIATGKPGDATGIYAFNCYNVSSAVDVLGNVYHVGTANTLGLGLPAGERGDFTELRVGEMYKWGKGNFSTAPDEGLIYATISNGMLVATDTAPTDGSIYFEILREDGFTRGSRYAFDGYVLRCLRSVAA